MSARELDACAAAADWIRDAGRLLPTESVREELAGWPDLTADDVVQLVDLHADVHEPAFLTLLAPLPDETREPLPPTRAELEGEPWEVQELMTLRRKVTELGHDPTGMTPPDMRSVIREASAIADGPSRGGWLLDAADLLAEPDPGPTPWLVEDLVVAQAIVALVGRWKTTKSYALLYLCIAIATGEPAFGRPVAAGPVVYVCEESGRAALWRRLDALCRGYAIEPDRLRGRLHVATNARVKLDDPGWQDELVALGRDLRPRLFAFDPLARMKAAARDENAQKEMAPVLEFLRELRDQTSAAAAVVHHTGHAGDHMRGSSDLESIWETRLTWEREGTSPLVTIKSEHREAETGDPISYRIDWDHDTCSMRFPRVDQAARARNLEADIEAWLRQHPLSSTNEVTDAIKGERKVISNVLKASDRFIFQKGPGTTRLWCVAENPTHPDAADAGSALSASEGGPLGPPDARRTSASDRCVGPTQPEELEWR